MMSSFLWVYLYALCGLVCAASFMCIVGTVMASIAVSPFLLFLLPVWIFVMCVFVFMGDRCLTRSMA